jgi:serine/threonine protein kinase/tetratricopeptide (TPR) repeat protein
MMQDEFRREYLLRLPLPVAQLYGRAYNAKSPRERHDNAFYLFEALVKLAASAATAYYLEEVSLGRVSRVPLLDRQLAQLALPSLGQWLAILRELSRHFGSRVDAAVHPWGTLWNQLSATRKDCPAILALYRRLKNGPDGDLAADQSCSFYNVLDALVQYRNAVFGHGAARFETFYTEEMGPLLFPAINELLADGKLSILGPTSARLVYLDEIRVREDRRKELGLRELVGTQSERIAPLVLTEEEFGNLAPNRVCLVWPGRVAPLRLDPLVQYRESELTEEVLFLNRDRNGKQVEYLSYTTGRTERDRSMLPALTALLSEVTNRAVSEADLQRLSEMSLSETPSVESLFATTVPSQPALGEYELLSELGRGGMGVVYLARQTSLGRVVALKMLPQDLSNDEVALARFRREIRHLAACDDPHIVKILSSGTFPDGRLYYTMEYVPGSDLEIVWRELAGSPDTPQSATSSMLLGNTVWSQAVLSASRRQRERAEGSRGGSLQNEPLGSRGPTLESSTDAKPVPLPLPPLPHISDGVDEAGGFVRRVVTLSRDVARALQTIHDKGIVHRDIKPANLVLTPDGTRVVLMDFGLAKEQSNSLAASHQGGLLGTLRYASPEQLASANIKVGPPADVRGLGVTMWELLTRQRLFGNAVDEAGLMQEVLTSDVPRLRTIDARFDRDLDAIVSCATARRISERIQTAGQLAELLQLWLDGKPLPIRLPTMPELAWRWLRENAWIASAAALLIVMAVITGGVTLRGMLRREQLSQEAWDQVARQSQQLLVETLPSLSADLRRTDVDIEKLKALLPGIRQQADIIEEISEGQGIDAETRQRAQAKFKEVHTSVAQFEQRFQAVERLLRARVLRFQVTDEAFQVADGMPVIFGRDALAIYKDVFTELAGGDVLDERREPADIAKALEGYDLADHLRLALDDWLVLSYAFNEQPVRERLNVVSNALDQGDGRVTRSALRKAILARDVNALETLAEEYLKSKSRDAGHVNTGLLLVDGLLENLRLQEATEVLAQLRAAGAGAKQNMTRFGRFWVNFLSGIGLNQIGSHDQIHEAIECFRSASAIDPTLDVVRLNMAISELRLARPTRAIELLNVIQDPALNTSRQIQLGVAFAATGQAKEARSVAEQLLKNAAGSVLAYHGAAVIYGEILDLEAAAKTALEGLRLDSGHPSLLWLAHGSDRSARQAAMQQVPPERLRRFWLAKLETEIENMQEGMREQDLRRVELAREELRQLGIQDWQLAWQEYIALFSLQNWNGDSWEVALRQLNEEAPRLWAEQVPFPILAALVATDKLIASPDARQLIIREVESAPFVYPPSPYRRLLASANMLQYMTPELAAMLYEAAKRQIPKLREAGYGSESTWTTMESLLDSSVKRTSDPEALNDRSLKGMRMRGDAFWQLGQARLRTKDFPAAQKYFEEYLAVAEEIVEVDPSDTHARRDISYANAWLSNVAFSHDDFETARIYVQRDIDNSESMAKEAPDDPDVQRHLARAYEMMVRVEEGRGNIDESRTWLNRARTIYEHLAKTSPLDGNLQNALVNCYEKLGRQYLDSGEYQAAEQYFQQCIPIAEQRHRAAPNNVVLRRELADKYTWLGKTQLFQRKIDEAWKQLNTSRELIESLASPGRAFPDIQGPSALVYFLLSSTSELRGDLAAAKRFLDQDVDFHRHGLATRSMDPNQTIFLASALGQRAEFHFRQQSYQDGLADLDEAIRLAPELSEHWHTRGTRRYQLNDVEGAIADFTESIRLNPQQTEAYRARSEALAWLERFPEALADLDAVPDNERNHVDFWISRTYIQYRMNRRAEAAADLERVVLLASDDADTLNVTGIWKLRLEDPVGAQELFAKAIEKMPSHFSAHRHLAATLAAQQDWDNARREYDKCMSQGLSFPLSWTESALISKLQQDEPRHQTIQDDLLLRFWTDPKAEDADSVAWAVTRFPRSDHEVHLRKFLTQWAAKPEELPLSDRTRGAIHYRLREWPEAEAVLHQSIAQPENSGDPRGLILLSWTLEKLGKEDQARAALDAARTALQQFEQGGGRFMSADGRIKWITVEEAKLLLSESEISGT